MVTARACRPAFLLLMLSFSVVVPAWAQPPLAAGGLERVEAELPGLVAERMRRGNLPGVAVVLVHGNEVIWARGFGRKNLAYQDPITPESVFRVASVTKQFVAMACLLLEQEGKLDLDDPVVRHVPDFRTKDDRHAGVTVGQLLSHQSGLPRGPYYGGRHGSIKEQVRDLARMDLAHAPGTAFKYSNTGYNLAGHVVEVVSGQPFDVFMRERILRPLGMLADFSLTPELSNDYATGYMTDHYRSFITESDELRAAPMYPAPAAAGQLYASALDVSKFLRCLLHRGRYGDTELISETLFQKMVTPFNEKLSTYGLGIGTSKLMGERVFQHTGGYYGHSSLEIGMPDRRLGGIVIVNRASSHHENTRILHHALALLLGREPPAPRVDPALAGRYANRDLQVEILARGGDLYWVEDSRVHRLEPYYGSSIRYIASGGSLAAWPIDLRDGRIVAGPTVLPREKNGRGTPDGPAAGSGSEAFRAYVGTYRDADFGDVVVFERDGGLFYAFSKMEQVPLRHLEGHRFLLTSGSFAGEPIEFSLGPDGAESLEAGYMPFQRCLPRSR